MYVYINHLTKENLSCKSIDSTLNWVGKNIVRMYDILNSIIILCNNELLKEKVSCKVSLIHSNYE